MSAERGPSPPGPGRLEALARTLAAGPSPRGALGWALAAAALMGLLSHLPVLAAPWVLDDYMHIGMLEGGFWVKRPPWELYRFVSGERGELEALLSSGAVPWWTDPELRAAGLRPLSSLLRAAEWALLGNRVGLTHLTSWLVFGALLAATARLLVSSLGPAVGLLGTVTYAVSRAHSVPLVWVANRCSLLAALFLALALHLHVEGRRAGRAGWVWLGAGSYALALASAEYGICTLLYLVSFELLAAPRGWAARARALAPAALVTAAYAVVYLATGSGARAMGDYADPVGEPGTFAVKLLMNLAHLLGHATLGAGGPGPLGVVVAVLGLGLLAVALQGAPAGSARERARWLLCGGLLSCVPLAAAPADARLLPVAALGVSGAVAAAGVDALGALAAGAARWRPGLAAACLVGFHFSLAPTAAWQEAASWVVLHRRLEANALQATLRDPAGEVLLVSAPETFTLSHAPMARRLAGGPQPRAWWVLSSADRAHRVIRVSEDVLDLEVVDGTLLDGRMAQAFRRPTRGFRVGEQVVAGRLRVTVLSVRDGRPLRVRFELPGLAQVTLLASMEGRLLPVELPAPGADVTLPAAMPVSPQGPTLGIDPAR